MQDNVFRGLTGWRQAALPNDKAKLSSLNLHKPGYNTAAPAFSHLKTTHHQREKHPLIYYQELYKDHCLH